MANHRVARLNLGGGGNIDQGHVVGQFDVLRFGIGLVLPVLILVVTHDGERGGNVRSRETKQVGSGGLSRKETRGSYRYWILINCIGGRTANGYLAPYI